MSKTQNILETLPPSTQNNARDIALSYMEKMIEKPSYYYQKKLERIGVGVQWTVEFGEEPQHVEDFYIIEGGEYDLSEENNPF